MYDIFRLVLGWKRHRRNIQDYKEDEVHEFSLFMAIFHIPPHTQRWPAQKQAPQKTMMRVWFIRMYHCWFSI